MTMKSLTVRGTGQFHGEDELPVAHSPAPGYFYDIRSGDGGLLNTVGRAYGLDQGAQRLRAAQEVNNHPLNRKFWRSPQNDFERRHFPSGIIGFKPQYACGNALPEPDTKAKRCFARIWMPPMPGAYHPRLGHGIAFPASALSALSRTSTSGAPVTAPDVRNLFAPELCDMLDAGCTGVTQPDAVCAIGVDRRTEVTDTTLAPHRWICGLYLFFRETPHSPLVWAFGNATGFLVSDHHVLTSAHVIHNAVFGRYTRPVTAFAAAVIPGRDGILEDLLNLSTYGAFLVNDHNAFKVPPEWKRSRPVAAVFEGPTEFDYALVSLTNASPCKTISPRLTARPAGYWGAEHSGTHIAARLNGFRLSSIANLEVVAAGYPADKPCTQWSSRAKMRRIRYRGTAAHNVLEHDLYTVRGMSGSPVWGRVRIKGHWQLALIGIHSSCARDEQTSTVRYGESTLITKEVWRRIRAWMAT